MSERKLRHESPQETYFPANANVQEPVEETGTRELVALPPFLISGGENTERLYFQHISSLTDFKFIIKPEYFGKESEYATYFPQKIEEIIKANRDAKVFCVFDLDNILGDLESTSPKKRERAQKATKKYETFLKWVKKFAETEKIENQIVMCESMPCFEFWFLLHFEDCRKFMKDKGPVSNRLANYMKPLFEGITKKFSDVLKKKEYLEKQDWVKFLCSDEKMELAVERAKKNYEYIRQNKLLKSSSYSKVYHTSVH